MARLRPVGAMTSPFLAVECGNSRVKAALFAGDAAVPEMLHTPWAIPFDGDPAPALGQMLEHLPEGAAILMAATRSGARASLLAQAGSTPVRFLEHGAPMPVPYTYRSGAPGPDRLANALALAVRAPGRAAIAFDVGTATNAVVVDARGAFCGGAIFAGLAMMARALHRETAGRLPQLDVMQARAAHAVADSTEEALAAGILLGHAGALLHYTAQADAERGPFAVRVLTGGNAPYVLPYLTPGDFLHVPHLTLEGLAVWGSFLRGEGLLP